MSAPSNIIESHIPARNAAPVPWRLELPLSEFYWAELTLEGFDPRLSGTRGTRAMLENDFSVHVPVPIDELATAFVLLTESDPKTPGTPTRILACGLPLSRLAHPDASAAIEVTSSDIPAWARERTSNSVTLRDLNVLTGIHAPRSLRTARAGLSLARSATIALIATIAALGIGRWASETRQHAADARSALLDLGTRAQDIIPGQGDPTMRARRELARLQATRAQHARQGVLDASAALESVLAKWPADSKAKTAELAISASGITLRADVPDNEHAAALAAALTTAFDAPAGGQRATSEISTAGERRQVRLQLPLPANPGTPPPPTGGGT
jgi:hypothetical protein